MAQKFTKDGNNEVIKHLLAEQTKIGIGFTVAKKKTSAINPEPISYFQLFRFATAYEILQTIGGAGFLCVAGLGIPYNLIMFGELTQLYIDRTKNGVAEITTPTTDTYLNHLYGGAAFVVNGSKADNMAALVNDSMAFGIGTVAGVLVQIIFCFIGLDMINHSALKHVTRLRQLFLQAVLRQDIAWHETCGGNNFSTRIMEDLEQFKEGIADKLAIYIYYSAIFVTCMVTAFCYGWKLTSVVGVSVPLIIFSTAFITKMQSSMSTDETNVYEKAGTIAEEVLTAIRTVVAFGGEQKEVERYARQLQPTERTSRQKGIYSGIGGGSLWLVVYCTYALTYWYGIRLMLADRDAVVPHYTSAVLVTVLFCVILGAQNMGNATPHIEAFAMAKGAATAIYNIIERQPAIDSMVKHGLEPSSITGAVQMQNLHFEYPSRPGVPVLRGFTLDVAAGQTVALVGPSGCGKSTSLQLLQRFYDPTKGSIRLDKMDIKELNLKRLRSFTGVVGQEPVLFSTSIAENIRYGNPEATQADIEKVSRISNCHDFIVKLPLGYATLVGERGGLLSGGQKQRIAIARALIRNPSLLLLDEATSALDPHSESLVQTALDNASKGRTTIVVSHRLSTITNADKIVYVEDGRVTEQGTHNELVRMQGRYYDLVQAYNLKQTAREATNNEDKTECSIEALKENSNETTGWLDEKLKTDEHLDEQSQPSMWRILHLNTPEWRYNAIGCVSAIVVGVTFQIFSFLFGEFMNVLSVTDESAVRSDSARLAVYFVALGIAAGMGSFLQTYMFNVAGVRLTTRLRTMLFAHTLKQEMGWFDDVRNGVGNLCARLSGDCASVQGACGTRLGSMINSVVTITVGLSMGMYYSWKLSLVAIIPVPVVLACCYLESKLTAKGIQHEKQALEQACRTAIEAIANIKTVASLGQELETMKRYCAELTTAERACRAKIKYRGIVYALTQTMQILGYGLSYSFGGVMVAHGEIEYKVVMIVSAALVAGAWMLSQALSYAPNVNVAILSAGRILKMLARQPKYGCSSERKSMVSRNDGTVVFDDVTFSYPTRSAEPVLKSLSLSIQPRKTVALVGPSGCGKSTCVQLLLRYYDPTSGTIVLNGTRNSDLTLAGLRAEFGIVAQEPVLFDRTIAENIAYGDNSRTISISETIAAARIANIHNFVMALPAGYDTRMGAKGGQMSGGQKQRIAIARALVRNPRILLLDEATSALDCQSEGVVQAALEAASQGRTCITIAHRLSTVRSADVICVIEDGGIREMGTHEQLMRLGKNYRKLYDMQEVR